MLQVLYYIVKILYSAKLQLEDIQIYHNISEEMGSCSEMDEFEQILGNKLVKSVLPYVETWLELIYNNSKGSQM